MTTVTVMSVQLGEWAHHYPQGFLVTFYNLSFLSLSAQHLPLPLFPRQPRSWFLPLCFGLRFLKVYENGIPLYVLWFVWLLSLNMVIFRLIHVVLCVNSSFLLVSEEHSIVWINHVWLAIHQLIMDTLLIYTFWLLQVKLVWTFMYNSFHSHMLLLLMGE